MHRLFQVHWSLITGKGSFSSLPGEPGSVVEVVVGGGGEEGAGDITKQRHKSLKSVLSFSSQGHANLRERLTSLGLPEAGSKARGGLSDGVGAGQDGKSEAEDWEGFLQPAGPFTHQALTLD